MIGQRHVLVTGAGGFVCRNIVDALLKHDFTVLAVDRSFDSDLIASWDQIRAGKIEALQVDLHDIPEMRVDGIVHGAALTASPKEAEISPEEHLRANLEPTLKILEWATRNNLGRTVCISSSAVHDHTTGEVTEETPPSPDNMYAIAKAATEYLAHTLRHSYGRDVIAIRLSHVYGPGEQSRRSRPRVSLVSQMIESAFTTGSIRVQKSQETRDWTFAPDIGQVVNALLTMQEANYALYNVASGQYVTSLELAHIIASCIPDVEISVVSDMRASGSLTRQAYLSNQRLFSETGFDAWTPLEAGLKQVIAHRQALEMAQ